MNIFLYCLVMNEFGAKSCLQMRTKRVEKIYRSFWQILILLFMLCRKRRNQLKIPTL